MTATQRLLGTHGRRERIKIGQFPAVSLGKAREEARKLAAQKTLGLIAPKTEVSFPEAIEEFFTGYRRKNRATTVRETERFLRRYCAFTGDVAEIKTRETGTILGVAAIYNRATYMPEMREALQKWEQHLAALIQREYRAVR